VLGEVARRRQCQQSEAGQHLEGLHDEIQLRGPSI
jgi:hypothetical protein